MVSSLGPVLSHQYSQRHPRTLRFPREHTHTHKLLLASPQTHINDRNQHKVTIADCYLAYRRVGWRGPSCLKLLENIKRNLRTLSIQHLITESAANCFFCTQPQNQFDHFPEIKLHRMPPTGCGFSSYLVVWHPTSLNLLTISSHKYGCTVVDIPELLQIPHFHWQMLCCESSSRASSLTYSVMKVKLKRSSMYSALRVGYFHVKLTQLW